MKKALFLSHVPVFPEIGGDRIRIAQSLRLLSEIYYVDVVYMTNFTENVSVRQHVPSVRKERFFYSPKIKRYFRALKTVINGRPLIENLYLNPEMARHIREVYEEYDLIFCASPAVAQYVIGLRHPHKVIDLTDSLSMNRHNAMQKAKGLRRWLYKVDFKRMKNFETRTRNYFDSIAYISETDRNYIDAAGGKTHIVVNAVSPFSGKMSDCNVGEKHLVFVGKMDYEPNVLASTFFATKVMPILREEIPGIRFSIVGIAPSKSVLELGKLPGVKVTGYVESLDEWFEKASLFVAPMLSGSGVQNKILQALTHGCGVLTTPIGKEGIECLEDVIMVVDPRPSEWASRIKEIFINPVEIKEKALRAPGKVEQEFGIDVVRRQFHKFISQV